MCSLFYCKYPLCVCSLFYCKYPHQVGRSGDKFCMDVICLVIVLGVASVIYNMVSAVVHP
jgi:hypothetical protein